MPRPDEEPMRLDGDAELNSILSALDHPAPRVTAAAIAARARGSSNDWLRRAAIVTLAVGIAGAAYAAPGSPLRDWLRSAAGGLAVVETPEPSAAPVAPTPASPPRSGVALDPSRPQLIVFDASARGTVVVSIVEAGALTVSVASGDASFTSQQDRLTVDHLVPAARVEIAIPANAARVELRAGDRVVLVRDASSSSVAPAPDGSYRIELTPAP